MTKQPVRAINVSILAFKNTAYFAFALLSRLSEKVAGESLGEGSGHNFPLQLEHLQHLPSFKHILIKMCLMQGEC